MTGGGWRGALRLRFADPATEAAFRREFNAAALPHLRVAGALAIVMYAAFGVLDAIVAPEDVAVLFGIRGGVVACIALALIVQERLDRDRLDALQQALICSVVVIAAAGLAAMPIVADVPASYASTGNLLILIYLFSFARVRFAPAMVTSALVVLSYEASEVARQVDMTTAAYNNFFLLGFIVIGASTCFVLERLRRREFLYADALRSAFGSYVSDDLVERVVGGDAVIAGEEVEVTVLFSDIRDFTSLAERSPPRETVALLNEFWGLVLPIVRMHGGHVNKLLGDGLLAVFGAPIFLPDHADRAAAAAADIVGTVRGRFEEELRMGVGLNSGTVVAGTIGDRGKLDYTLIGDAVNVASRVEQLTKETGDAILLTEATRSRLMRQLKLEPRGERQLRGKARATAVHALVLDPMPASLQPPAWRP